MKHQILLLLLLISFSFEFRRHSFIRKLQSETEIPTPELETIDSETTLPFVIPFHDPESTVPLTEPTLPFVIPFHDPESTVPLTEPTLPFVIPFHDPEATAPLTEPSGSGAGPNINATETETPTTIPTVISQPVYDPFRTEPILIIFVGIGNFTLPLRLPNLVPKRKVVFQIYYKRIFGKTVLPIHMYLYLKVTYRRLRDLQEGEGETEVRDERAVCNRTTYDEDPNIRYNCSFDVDDNFELTKITMDPTSSPIFEGMSDAIVPTITVSSLVNETLFEKGIQTATGDDLLKTQYLMNNTVLEGNGLRFKLIGEMDSYLTDNKVILSFDEKGDGKIKNATCDVSNVKGNVFELDCLMEKGINAHLNGVSGVTANTKERVIIYMRPGTDEILNTDSNYIGYYNKGSSSGLSGGAIAGIVIASVIALLAFAIGVMLCRKPKVPAPFQESTLGINISNITD